MCLETTHDALVIGLYMRGKVRLEVFDLNISESVGDNMPQEIVL